MLPLHSRLTSCARTLKTVCQRNATVKNRGGRIALALGAFCLIALVPIVTRAQNSSGLTEVEGGDFETPAYSSAPFYAYTPAGDARWTWSGAAGVQRNGSGLGADAPKGVQTAFLRSANGAPSRFSAPITLDAGAYRVRFKAAQRLSSGGVPIQIKLDNTSVGAPIMPTNTAFEVYKSVPFQVSAAGSTYRLEFGTDSVGGNAMSLIDAILIEAVPSATMNGGFEAPVTDIAPFYVFGPSGSGWTWSGAAGVQRNGSGLGADAPAGVQTALVRGGSTAGAFSQSVSLGAGNSYRVKFRAAQRGTGNGVPIQVKVDGVAIGAPIVPSSTAFAACATVPFMASAGSNVIQFATDSGNSNWMSLIDEVTIEDTSSVVLPAPLAPFAPKALTVTTATGRANLTWRTVDGASGYRIKRAQVAGGPYVILPTVLNGINSNSFQDSPQSDGATYYYRVYAFNAAGAGADSREVSATLIESPSAPTLSATVTGSNSTNAVVNLNWTAAPTATSYQLYRLDSNDQSSSFFGLTGLALTDSSVAYGQTYRYRAYAYNDGGYSSPSNEVNVTVVLPPAAPALTATPGNATVALSWNGVSGATHYRLKRGVAAGGPYTMLPNVIGGTTFSDSGLTNGTTYYYRVTAINAGGNSPDSNEASAKPTAPPVTPPTAPTNVTATPGNASVSLTWNAVSGAISYKLKRGTTAGGPYATLAPIISGTNFSDSGLSNGTTYYYRVTAVNSAGNGADSAEVQATPVAPIPLPVAPANLVAAAGNTQITLSWNAVSGAASYKIKRSTTNGGPYTTLAPSVTANAYTDTGLSNGTPYYYRVYAVNASGNGPDSNQAQATPVAPVTPPVAPTGFTATAVGSKITLSWNAVNGATNYKLFRSTTSGTYNYATPLATIAAPATSHDDNTAANGTTYFYVVRSFNAAGESIDSVEKFAKVAVEPFTILNISNGDVLSGMINVNVQVNDPQIATLSLVLLLNGEEVAYFIPLETEGNENQNIWSALVKTETLSNGSSLTLEVKDGLGHSQTRSIGIQNDISNLTFGTIFDVTPSATDVPHASHVTATVANGSGWTATVENDSQQVVRTFNGSGPNIDFFWDGRSATGVEQPDSNYLISIRKSSPVNLRSNSSGGYALKFPGLDTQEYCGGNSVSTKTNECGVQFVQLSGSAPTEFLVNKNRIVDTMILLDETAVSSYGADPIGAARVMLNYSRYIRTQISTRAFQFDYPANPIIISSSLKPKEGYKDAVHARIRSQFADKPLKLVYVDSHGQDSEGVPGAHFFFAGGVAYYAKDPVSSPRSRRVIISDLTYKWNYGELGDNDNPPTDPPKLVWIHACESAGSRSREGLEGSPTMSTGYDLAFPSQRGDINSWAECFGIDPARGYEGAFIGISGYGKTIGQNPNASWNRMRYDIWYGLFTEGRNVRNALLGALGSAPYYVEQRYRIYGTFSTSF